jgi:sodium-dependent dicarboxylate transporter 2/3/5
MTSPGLASPEERREPWRRRIGLWLGPLAFVVVLLAPLPLSDPAQRVASVAALVLIFWVTEALPLAVTALLGPALAVALGVARSREVLAPFADPVLFLFLASFLLAEALRVHGVDRRIALWILTRRGTAASQVRGRIALGLATLMLSMWLNNAATAAIMLPIAVGLVRCLATTGSRESGTGTLLSVGIAASLGGIVTPLGATSNLVALGFLEQVGGRRPSFAAFTAIGLPVAVVLMGLVLLVIRIAFPARGAGKDPAIYVALARERSAQAGWGSAQSACAVPFALAVVGWAVISFERLLHTGGGLAVRFDEAVVGLLVAVLLFAWPVGGRRVLAWEDATRIDWGTLVLFGGGLAMAKLVFDTGLAAVLARAALSATGVTSLWGLTALALGAAILLTEVAPNVSTVGLLAPLVLAAARDQGLPLTPPLLGVCFGASLGFMLPVGTPPSAMVYGTRLVPLAAMMGVGFVADLLGFLVVLGSLRLLCPVLGLA